MLRKKRTKARIARISLLKDFKIQETGETISANALETLIDLVEDVEIHFKITISDSVLTKAFRNHTHILQGLITELAQVYASNLETYIEHHEVFFNVN